jgi:hypothetical protein
MDTEVIYYIEGQEVYKVCIWEKKRKLLGKHETNTEYFEDDKMKTLPFAYWIRHCSERNSIPE